MGNVPKHLSPDAARWWWLLRDEYGVADGAGLVLLTVAAEAWQRADEARQQIAAEGATVIDRFGQRVPHPAVRIEHNARAQLLQALRALHFDIEPLRGVGRPTSPLGITEAF